MFERCLYFNINALARSVNQIWEQAFLKYDLSPSHAYLLRLVLSKPGLTPGQIASELKLEKSTVSRFISALQVKKLVSRQKGLTSDAREHGIFPTPKSKSIAKDLEATGRQLYQQMLDKIGKSELISMVEEIKVTRNSII